jgi:hypothetical protein
MGGLDSRKSKTVSPRFLKTDRVIYKFTDEFADENVQQPHFFLTRTRPEMKKTLTMREQSVLDDIEFPSMI